MDKITLSQYVVMWFSGYCNNTIIDPDAAKKNEENATNTAKRR